jgi:tetratricopeptide (TPR) repeat protein
MDGVSVSQQEELAMFHHESADTERFEQVILEAVRQVLAASGPEPFLDWARAQIPHTLHLDELDLDEVEARRLAHLLGTAVWNATPQPAQGYRAVPLPTPPADAPCPCGSDSPYGRCCGDIQDLPVLSTDLIWELLLDELPERDQEEALARDAVPHHLWAKIADRWLEEQDKPGRAVGLLEPLFAGPLGGLGAELEPAFDVLCDAYDRLDHTRKKQAFLARLCEEGSPTLRAAAWQRQSTMHIDAGDFPRAQSAFESALRSDPDNPSTALLEITLLAAQHKDAVARERARFWYHRLRRAGLREQGFLDFLVRAMEDPQEALVDSHSDALDPVLVDLHDWVKLAAARPLPSYRLTPFRPPRARHPAGQLSLFDESEGPVGRRLGLSEGLSVELQAPGPVRRLETLWRVLFPAMKPHSTRLAVEEERSVWLERGWSDYLLAHPEAADSLDVLDDLATALYEHPESVLPWVAHALLRPILDRAWGILVQALPARAACQIPWSRARNRPALRLLFRRYLCQMEEGEPQGGAETLETLLRLNPSDNHGVRAELMNHYLRAGEDEKALALARRFPDDVLADLAYGEVLALYRLGEQDGARAALRTAARRLPRVPQYLTRKRIKRPRLSPLGMTPGGEDQAWLYREAMRDVWESEPGLLKWMKRVTA